MNDTLAPARSLDSDRLLLPLTSHSHPTLAARLELRLGLWLLLRSTRHHRGVRDPDEHTRRFANARSLEARHTAALRAHAVNGVRT